MPFDTMISKIHLVCMKFEILMNFILFIQNYMLGETTFETPLLSKRLIMLWRYPTNADVYKFAHIF